MKKKETRIFICLSVLDRRSFVREEAVTPLFNQSVSNNSNRVRRRLSRGSFTSDRSFKVINFIVLMYLDQVACENVSDTF